MGRARLFDRETAMDLALREFWLNGFDRTSLEDLLKCMGIKNSSFYQAFLSKEHLFVEVLERYRAHAVQERVKILLDESLSARESLLGYFRYVIYTGPKNGFPIGCFLTSTIASLVDPHSHVGREALQSLKKVERNFLLVLKRARSRNELRPTASPEQGSRLLLTFLTGINTVARGKRSQRELMASATTLIDLLLKSKKSTKSNLTQVEKL